MKERAEGAQVRDRFGFLLKHARERLSAISGPALIPTGINGRELAVLTVLVQGEPPSQLEAAQRLGIDRSTMVTLIDELEAKALVERRPDGVDRRRNIVALTSRGRKTLAAATEIVDAAEREFLAPLSAHDAKRFREMLQVVTFPGPHRARPPR
ncbi:MAG TPA: MarR family transcriptional regulator [Candidatus Acidoferrum sp.]|jgi:DNA-binding MarR family transcriptional regulator|nr:MarR family transcriptional regulator [Candidatus Acidoferrum sp.]